jgi:O-succinylbenzoate synthase
MNITDISILSLPMRSKFRSVSTREIAIFKGVRWSEFSPFVEYPDAEAAAWLKAALSWANDPLPPLKRTTIPTNATLPAVTPEQVAEVLNNFGKFRSVKIKVGEAGQSRAEDLARIRRVFELYPSVSVRLDANGALSPAEALAMCEELQGESIEYFEQPVATIQDMRQLRLELARRGIGIKIAADELIRKANDPYLVAKEDAADIAVLKVQPLGGIEPSLRIAKEIGLDCVVSSAIESSIGLSHGLYLAGAMPELKFDCGLATASLLAGDVTHRSLVAIDGEIEIRDVEPDSDLIEKYSAPKERADWWLRRMERCFSLLEA